MRCSPAGRKSQAAANDLIRAVAQHAGRRRRGRGHGAAHRHAPRHAGRPGGLSAFLEKRPAAWVRAETVS